MSSKQGSGFVLSELMLAVTFGAIILAVLSPELSGARVASNEKAAVSALRSIASAQAQLVSSAVIDADCFDAIEYGYIDSDCDGVGEYGYLGELAGSAPLRVYDPVADAPALDGNGLGLTSPLLPLAFTNTELHNAGEAEVERGGYRFKLYLPSYTQVDKHIRGIPETGANGVGGATAGSFPDASNCAKFWVCYAWPDEVRRTGQRAFFINQEGRLMKTGNNARSRRTARFYDGPGGGPAYDAALSDAPASPNGTTGMGALLGIPPRKAGDGNVWTRLGR